MEFTQDGVTEEQVRAAVSGLPGDEIVQRYGAAADRQFLIRLPLASSGSDGLEGTVRQIAQALRAAGLPEFAFEKRELVSAVIGSDLQRRGIYAVAASLAAIAVYIAHPFSRRLCGRARSRPRCTTCWSRWPASRWPATTCH